MKSTIVETVVCSLGLCLMGCSMDQLTYTRQLRPGMTVEQVKALFPQRMLSLDEVVDEAKHNCWMQRCYSTNVIVRRLCFSDPNRIGYRATDVYFDSADKLVGLFFSTSSGSELRPDELRFPGELRAPNGRDALPADFRAAAGRSSTNKP
jgi:hypothetical protein